jgi:hypothetical protein
MKLIKWRNLVKLCENPHMFRIQNYYTGLNLIGGGGVKLKVDEWF